MAASEKTTLRDLGEEVQPKKEFFAYGPAFDGKGVVRFVTDQVQTTHPKSGHKRTIAAPAPSKRIKGVLGELTDLAKQADEEVRTLQQAQAEVARLKKELHVAQKAQPKAVAGTASPKLALLQQDVKQAIRQRDAWWREKYDGLAKQMKDRDRRVTRLGQELKRITEASAIAWRLAEELPPTDLTTPTPAMVDGAAAVANQPRRLNASPAAVSVDRSSPAVARGSAAPSGSDIAGGIVGGFDKAARLFLRACYWLKDEQPSASKVAFYAGYANGGSTFRNSMGTLRTSGLVKGFAITEAGLAAIPVDVEAKPTGPELREWLRPKLDKAENALLDALIEAYPDRLSDQQIGEQTGYTAGGSSFRNAIGTLRTLEAAEGYARTGGVKAADVFFEGV
jgi:hypothetical protein